MDRRAFLTGLFSSPLALSAVPVAAEDCVEVDVVVNVDRTGEIKAAVVEELRRYDQMLPSRVHAINAGRYARG
jgi:hypothetical protein